jgi:hypothetical protein
MIGIREKRRIRARSDDGQEHELIEYQKIIDTTTMRSKWHEQAEGNKHHFMTITGELVELVGQGIYERSDGMILRESVQT